MRSAPGGANGADRAAVDGLAQVISSVEPDSMMDGAAETILAKDEEIRRRHDALP